MVDSAPEFSLYDYSADLRSFSSPEEAAEGHVDFDGSFASDLVRIPTSELLPGDPNLFNDTDSGIFNHSGLPNIHGPELTQMVGSPDLNKMPTLDEIESPHDFDMDLRYQKDTSANWVYSPKLRKIFVKFKQTINIFPNYKVLDKISLFLRAMIVPVSHEDIMSPLIVCPNHRATDSENSAHILRCMNKSAVYEGTEIGVKNADRLQVVLPLCNRAPNEPVQYQFLCQNSCPGGMQRKQTALIFQLEDEFRNVLGKRILHFKVCSCPKRDKDKEERDVKDMPKKRKPDQMASTSTAKKPKIKIEPDTVGLSQNSTDSLQNDIFNLESFKLDLVLPSKESAMHVLDCAFNSISAEIQKCNDSMKIDRLKANQASLLLQKEKLRNSY